MSSRRTMILIVAIALAVVASFALWSYIQGVKDDLAEDTQLVDVLILTTDVAEGTTGETAGAASIAVEKVPANVKPGNAITDRDQILGKIAISNLAARQILVPGMFVDPAVAVTSFSDYLYPNMTTVSLSMDKIAAAGGVLKPGDRVNIFVKVSQNEEPAADEAADGEPGAEQPADTGTGDGEQVPYDGDIVGTPVRMLYQASEILAIDGKLVPQTAAAVAADTTGGAGGGVFTFQVPVDVAQFIYSIEASQLIFSLISQDYEIVPLPPLLPEVNETLPGEDAEVLTFCGPDGPTGCEPGDGGGESADDGLDLGGALPLGDDENSDSEPLEAGAGS